LNPLAPMMGALAGALWLGAALPVDEASRLGGPATVDAEGPNAFSLATPGLSREERRAFSVGNSFFRDNWVVAPASADGRDGLGPLFNANSCSACHQEDGRGRPPRSGDDVGAGMVVFISPQNDDGAPHPIYGHQVQDQANAGVQPEARILVGAQLMPGAYADGAPFELRRWTLEFVDPGYGPLGPVRTSMRIGPQLIGVGLLEALDDATIVALEDPEDRNADGISGRAARRARSAQGGPSIGRFGWKASQSTIEEQVIAALHEDMGITSARRSEESLTDFQRISVTAPSGGSPEIDQHKIDRIAHYCRVLAVPRQRGADSPLVQRGRRLFAELNCVACHVPELRTGDASPIASHRDVTIRPYTDLLLHDMGDGLADHRRDGVATGLEWRTPPLWGIGLLETVNGHAHYLHDGRSRSLEEAILWHGGEAQRSRDGFWSMAADDRAALIAFLRWL